MRTPLGDPEAIEALAANVDRRADELSAAGRRLRERVNNARWSCQRADRFRQTMAAHQSELERRANDLHAIAGDLRRIARQVRGQIAALRSLENRIRNWLRWNQSTVQSLGLRLRLPGPADPAWNSVAATLRRFGIRV